MGVEKVILKDQEKQKEKYLFLLDYLLVKLKTGRPSGISFRNILKDYNSEMGTTLDGDEQKEFLQLYEGVWFTKEGIDRLKLKQQQSIQSSLKNDLQNNTNTQNIAPTKQPTKTATTIGGFMLALIITVIGGIIILIVWELWGNQIVNFLKPLP